MGYCNWLCLEVKWYFVKASWADSWYVPVDRYAILVTLVPSCNNLVFAKAVEFRFSRGYAAKYVDNTHCYVCIAKAKVSSVVKKLVNQYRSGSCAGYVRYVFAVPVDKVTAYLDYYSLVDVFHVLQLVSYSRWHFNGI